LDDSAAPLIQPIADQVAVIDTSFQLTIDADDPDPSDVLLYELLEAPAGLVIDPGTGELNWTPLFADIGVYTVRVRVSDPSGAADETFFELWVIADNLPPVIDVVPDRGAAPGNLVQVQVIAVDPDDDDIVFSLSERPTGITIDPTTGLIRWTPTTQQLGPHTVTVVAEDEFSALDQVSFEVFVDLNRAPVALDDSGYRVERGDTLMVPSPGVLINDSDPNGDALTSERMVGPSQGSLQLNSDGSFDYTPDNPVGTIGLQLKWEEVNSNGGPSGGWQPLIGQLDDDPAAEIIVHDSTATVTRIEAFDGDTGAQEWERSFGNREVGPSNEGEPALADIDLDGRPEILFVGGDPDSFPTRFLRLYALEHDGSLKWISESLPKQGYDPTRDEIRNQANGDIFDSAISVADLDGDGMPEIIVASGGEFTQFHVWDANGRKLDYAFNPGPRKSNSAPRVNVVDLDLDGEYEVLVGNTAFTREGEVIWSRDDVPDNGESYTFLQVANLDNDPFPELVRRPGRSLRNDVVAWNHDGTDLWEYDFDGSSSAFTWSPLTIADFNNDGQAEVLTASNQSEDQFDVLNGADGTILWSKDVPTGRAGATVFDLDRDGFNEVVFIDDLSNLHIWDGRDGTERLVVDLNGQNIFPTESTVPVFADVDADGRSELVLPGGFSFSSAPSLQVWESTNDDWAPMRAVWNQDPYFVTNINDDLTVPAEPRPHWLLPGLNQAMVNERLPEDRVEEQDQFTYRANDGELVSNTATVNITILPPNAAPQILSAPRTTASPGFEYVYQALAVDADAGELLVWAIAEGPAGLSVDSQGRLTWTPMAADLGEHTVVLQVTDTIGVSGFQTFVIRVQGAVSVPNLAGLTDVQAIDAVEGAGLRVDPLREVFSDLIAAGLVVSQSPAAGTSAAAGDSVLVEVSLGPLPVAVPDVITLTLDDATTAILDQGFALGSIDYVNDDLQPVGTILIQDPAPRTRAVPGTMLDLTISGGPRATIEITPPVIRAGGSADVTVVVRDVDGSVLDPQPAVSLSLVFSPGDVLGTAPTLNAGTLSTNADSQGLLEVQAQFTTRGTEQVSATAVIAQAVSDGDGANIH
ncbi:MAG: putative Ig domain-containing protein, partial [Pseudomonadota bacterium]